jgi:putative transposase
MPRKPRNAPAGLVYHVLNRAAGRITLFRDDADYAAFARILCQAHQRVPIDLFAYCFMPNHWHFLLRPHRDGDLTAFLRWLTHTHAMRWRVAHHTVGLGPLYQGRFKSFPVQCDHHFATVARYVERNPSTANLARRAQDWPWSSLHTREHAARDPAHKDLNAILSPWPIPRPRHWPNTVNAPLTPKELERLETSEARGRPFGDDHWLNQTVTRLSLQHTIRPEGRPKKQEKGQKGSGGK